MAKEALDQIKSLEEKVVKDIKEARVKAEKSLQKANDEIERIKKDALLKAETRRAEILAEALSAAKQRYEPILAEKRGEINSLGALDNERFDRAVNFIVERMVNAVGHR